MKVKKKHVSFLILAILERDRKRNDSLLIDWERDLITYREKNLFLKKIVTIFFYRNCSFILLFIEFNRTNPLGHPNPIPIPKT